MQETSSNMASTKPKVTLHWLEKSRSQRILWLIYELDIPSKADFNLKVYKRGKDMLAPSALKDVHPLGKSPVIEVQGPNQPKSIIIAESGAIVEYLSEHFGRHLIPQRYPEGKDGEIGAETETWLRYAQLMQYAEGSLMSMLILAFVVGMIKDGPQTPFFIKPLTRAIGSRVESAFITRNLEGHFSYVEGLISSSPDNGHFLCGPELSGADILMVYPLEAAMGRAGLDKEKYPKTCAYVERLCQREAYKKAVQRIIDETGEFSMSLM